MKTCSTCDLEKSLDNFYKKISSGDTYRNRCKTCCIATSKAYNNKNKVYREQRRKNSSIDRKEYFRQYYLKNREDCINKSSNYIRKRIKTNLNFKIRSYLRNRLNSAIKNNQKAGSAVSDLGCSIPDLKLHLESLFKSGMTWDNWSYKGWHIDHIKPLSSFDLTNPEQFKLAVSYTNLQPLWAIDNLKKSSSII